MAAQTNTAQAGDEELRDHARRAHQRALPLAAERPRGRGVRVGERVEDQEHQADGVNASSETPHRAGVPQLVQRLDEDQGEVQEGQVRTGEDPLGLDPELAGVIDDHRDRPQRRTEAQRAAPTGLITSADERLQPPEQPVRIEERECGRT